MKTLPVFPDWGLQYICTYHNGRGFTFCSNLFDRFYLIDDLTDGVERQLAKLKDEHEPLCRVPVITSLEEEHLIVSTSAKVRVWSNNWEGGMGMGGTSIQMTNFKSRHYMVLNIFPGLP